MPDVSRYNVDRLQDDWFIGVDSLEKAEAVLAAINAVYRDYGLEINGSKTSVDRVIAASGSHWVSEMGAFLSHRSGPISGVRLREFLSLSLRLQATYPSDPVLNYSLSTLESHRIVPTDVEALESFLLKGALISPISMDQICRIILNLQNRTNNVSRKRIGDRFTALAERNLERGNLYEVIWLVYTIRGLKVPLNSKRIRDLVEKAPSSAFALLLLDMSSKGLCIGKLPTTEWSAQITKERVQSDWIWLLGYEGIRHGWLPDPAKVMNEPFFRAMASRGVVFYNPNRNVLHSRTIVKIKKRTRKRFMLEALKLIQDMRGFNVDEY